MSLRYCQTRDGMSNNDRAKISKRESINTATKSCVSLSCDIVRYLCPSRSTRAAPAASCRYQRRRSTHRPKTIAVAVVVASCRLAKTDAAAVQVSLAALAVVATSVAVVVVVFAVVVVSLALIASLVDQRTTCPGKTNRIFIAST
jgi:hypothetical protein